MHQRSGSTKQSSSSFSLSSSIRRSTQPERPQRRWQGWPVRLGLVVTLALSVLWPEAVSAQTTKPPTPTTAPAAPVVVDANRANQAELEMVRGIGPHLSGTILAARGQQPFKDWVDFIGRTSGVGAARAAKLSAAGLRVNGQGFDAASGALLAHKPGKAAPRPAVMASQPVK